MLQASERPKPTASRVRRIDTAFLSAVARLKVRAERALQQRSKTDEEKRIVMALIDRLEASLAELRTLPLPTDPREARRARKRPHSETSDREAEFSWQYGRYGNG